MKARKGQVRLRLTAPRGQHRESPRPSLIDDSGLQSALAYTSFSRQADRAAPHVDAAQAITEITKLLVPGPAAIRRSSPLQHDR